MKNFELTTLYFKNFETARFGYIILFLLSISVFDNVIAQTPIWESIEQDKFSTAIYVTYDPNDNSNKKAWACGAGLWVNNDITNISSKWTDVSLNQKLAYTCFQEIVFGSNPQIVYANATSCHIYEEDNVIYKSNDGGNSWTLLFEDKSSGASFSKLKVDNQNNLYFSNRGKLHRLQLNATNSVEIFGTEPVNDYEIMGNSILIGTTKGKIFKNENGVSVNVSPSTTSTTGRVEIAPFIGSSGNIAYVLCREERNGFRWGYKTTDLGVNWNAIGLPNNYIYDEFSFDTYPFIFEVNPTDSRYLTCGQKSLTKSLDYGMNWVTPIWLLQRKYAIQVSFSKTNYAADLLIAKEDGVYTSSTLGKDFGSPITLTRMASNLQNGTVSMLTQANRQSKKITFVGSEQDYFYKTTNGTATEIFGNPTSWTVFDEDEHNKILCIHLGGDLTLRDSLGVQVKEVSNNFYSVSAVAGLDFPFDYNSAYDFFWGSTGGGGSRPLSFSKAFDIGKQERVSRFEVNVPGEYFRVLKSGFDDSTFYWGGSQGYIYKSNYNQKTNAVTNIKLNNTQSLGRSIGSLDVATNGYIICSSLGVPTINNILFSTDDGLTWQNKHSNTNSLPNVQINSIRFNPNEPKQVVINTTEALYYSPAGTALWACDDITIADPVWYKLTTNFPKVPISFFSFKKSTSTLLVGTSSVMNGFFDKKFSRGSYQTDFFENTVTKRIELSKSYFNLCNAAGSIQNIAFFEYGDFNGSVTFQLEVSETTDFSQSVVISTTHESPFSYNPTGISVGKYYYRVRSSDGIISPTGEFNVEQKALFATGFPKVFNITNESAILGVRFPENATLYYGLDYNTNVSLTKSQLLKGKNSEGSDFLNSGTLDIQADSTYFIHLDNHASDSLTVFLVADNGSCFSDVESVDYDLESIPYEMGCTPSFSAADCSPLAEVKPLQISLNPAFGTYRYQPPLDIDCSSSGYTSTQKFLKVARNIQPNTIEPPIVANFILLNTYNWGYRGYRYLSIYIDRDRNGNFDSNEKIETVYPAVIERISFPRYSLKAYIAVAQWPQNGGVYRVRAIASANPIESPCVNATTGAAFDFNVDVILFSSNQEISIVSNISTENTVEPEDSVVVYSTISGSFDFGNTFKIELSDANGDFSNANTLVMELSTVDINQVAIPIDTEDGTNYKIRAVSTSPILYGSPSAPFEVRNSCKQDLTIDYSVSGSQNIQARNSITLKSLISGEITVEADAGQSVLLLPGFEIDKSTNTVFKTKLVGCE